MQTLCGFAFKHFSTQSLLRPFNETLKLYSLSRHYCRSARSAQSYDRNRNSDQKLKSWTKIALDYDQCKKRPAIYKKELILSLKMLDKTESYVSSEPVVTIRASLQAIAVNEKRRRRAIAPIQQSQSEVQSALWPNRSILWAILHLSHMYGTPAVEKLNWKTVFTVCHYFSL